MTTTNFDGPLIATSKRQLATDLSDGSTAITGTFALAANQDVTNSATRVNASAPLVFTAEASSKYVVEYDLYITGDATADFKVGLVAPTSSTVTGAASDCITIDGPLTAVADTVTIPTNGTTRVHARVVATITTSTTAGTAGISWAQAVATSGQTTTILAGSSVRIAKVG